MKIIKFNTLTVLQIIWCLVYVLSCYGCQQLTKNQEEDNQMEFIFQRSIPVILPATKADNLTLDYGSVPTIGLFFGIVFPYVSPEGINLDGVSLDSGLEVLGYRVHFAGAKGLRPGSSVTLPNENCTPVNLGTTRKPEGGNYLNVIWDGEDWKTLNQLFTVLPGELTRRPTLATLAPIIVDTRSLLTAYLSQPATMVIQIKVRATHEVAP